MASSNRQFFHLTFNNLLPDLIFRKKIFRNSLVNNSIHIDTDGSSSHVDSSEEVLCYDVITKEKITQAIKCPIIVDKMVPLYPETISLLMAIKIIKIIETFSKVKNKTNNPCVH